MRDKPSAVHLNSVKGDIKFHDVSFRYAPGMPPIVDDVNLHIRQGETIAIVGPSGGGKTTLAKLLLRLYHPQSGTELNTRGKQCIFCQMLYMSRPFSLSLASRTPILLVTFYYYLLIWLLVNFLFRIYSSGQP